MSRGAALLLLLSGIFLPLPLFAERPYDAYLAEAKRGVTDARVRAFVAACTENRAHRPEMFYSQGGWFRTDNLAAEMRDRGADVDATAEVWQVNGKPRAIYQWTHDDEFDRDVLACLDEQGKVTHSVSRYMPGSSEPDQRWIYVHTLEWNPATGHYVAHGRFTDWQGRPRGKPHWSTEDQDFIAGEPVYHRWAEFDFAGAAAR